MVKVYYKNSRKTYMVQTPHLDTQIWIITKRFKLNPATNRDHDYNPDFYKREIQTGAMTAHRCVDLTDPVAVAQRAIQVMLHQQTNYDDLVAEGLYDQNYDIINKCLCAWYDMIGRRFPAYAEVCQRELYRHLTKVSAQRLTGK